MNMRYISFLLVLVCACEAHAQWSPSFDQDVYLPKDDNPEQVTSRYGTRSGQLLGKAFLNLGPKSDGTGDRVILQGLATEGPFLSEFTVHPTFTLNSIKATSWNFNPKYNGKYNFRRAQLRTSRTTDLVTYTDAYEFPIIYWADDEGRYDSSRYTVLQSSRRGALDEPQAFTHYVISRNEEDTVDHIYALVKKIDGSGQRRDTAFAVRFNGGDGLYQKGHVAIEDSIQFIGLGVRGPLGDSLYERGGTSIDLQGNGREAYVMFTRVGNAFIFRNEGSNSLSTFAWSLVYDTLWSAKKYPYVRNQNFDQYAGAWGIQALPRQPGDSSRDLLLSLYTDDDREGDLFIFRGGKNFKGQIDLDHPDEIMHRPGHYDIALDAMIWPSFVQDMGDMTGTGNRVMLAGGVTSFYGLSFFYVLGRALDDKVDMYFDETLAGDTIHANNDGRTDFLTGKPFYVTEADKARGKENVGLLRLFYGSDKIPVKLNPKYGVKPTLDEDLKLMCFPNPAHTETSISNLDGRPGEMRVIDVMGKTITRHSIAVGQTQCSIDLRGLPIGVYTAQYLTATGRSSTRLVRN